MKYRITFLWGNRNPEDTISMTEIVDVKNIEDARQEAFNMSKTYGLHIERIDRVNEEISPNFIED